MEDIAVLRRNVYFKWYFNMCKKKKFSMELFLLSSQIKIYTWICDGSFWEAVTLPHVEYFWSTLTILLKFALEITI